ncbi:MAG TPA: DUF6600 domain-containing protein [Puia sp.]
MKKHLFAIVAITIVFISCGPVYVAQSTPQTAPQEEAPEITYQTFYDDLSPYGQWIDYPDYGYVWMPNAGPDFRPYATNGQWVYTDDGWAWSSGYNWGWATFHYGRWFFDANYGWMWIPGYQWAPAWVSWRQSQDYYGWAPLGPRVNVDVAVSNYNPPANYWCFVPHQYVSSPSMSNYYVNETRNTTIINNTTVINNYTVNNVTNNNTNITNNRTTVNNVRNNFVTGPDPREVSRFTGTTVAPAVIRQSTSHTERFNNGQLEIYRPKVNANSTSNNNNNAANNNTQQRIAPTHFVPLSNARPMFNRPVNSQPTNNANNNVRQEPANNTNTNPANTNSNSTRPIPNPNQIQQPVNNNNPNNNVRQQPANNTNTTPVNTNNNPTRPNPNPKPVNNNNPNNNARQQPVNNNNPVQRNAQNNNSNNQNRNNRFNHQQDSIKRANKNIKAPKDNPKDQHN